MATASGPKAARPTDTASAPGRAAPGPKVTPVPVPKPGSIPSLPPSATAAARPPATNPTPASVTAPLPGFGLIAPSDTNLQDAAAGPHRDGRIRNPVPSKLKGKTDGSKGNFSVMHMEVAGRSEATERDAQAKRTSESTELAAKRAFENGYVSLRRSRFVHVPDDDAGKPAVPAKAQASASASAPSPVSASAMTNPQSRKSPLNSHETKSEQARLLTLLRSLHPVLVVDQICKALAFFGGIPGALPPADGEFPQSAEANGSGNLFVGWIAEIFPKLTSGQQNPNPARLLEGSESTRRRRGRPKGSKATKARKDKGIKKNPGKAVSNQGQTQAPGAPDESWIDVEDDAIGDTDNVDANVMLLTQVGSPQPSQIPVAPKEQQETAMSRPDNQGPVTPARTALPSTTGIGGSKADGLSSTKKRGRPKGSKNRPKDLEVAGPTSGTLQEASQTTQPSQIPLQPPPVPQEDAAMGQTFTSINSASRTNPKKKATKPRAPSSTQISSNHPGTLPAQSRTQLTTPAVPASLGPPSQSQATVNKPSGHFGQTQAYSDSHAIQSSAGAMVAQAHKRSAQKKKRKADNDAGVVQANQAGEGGGLTLPSNGDGVLTPPSVSQQYRLPSASPSAVNKPPAKRQRKAKEPNTIKKTNPVTGANSTEGTADNPSSAPAPALDSEATSAIPSEHMATTPIDPGPSQTSVPISIEPSMPPIHSPQHNHFEVQSPMENYEAQLQAQLEQQTEAEQHHQQLPTQTRVETESLLTRLQQQPQQQRRHQVHQSLQRNQQHQSSLSPNTQPLAAPAQTASPMLAQQQARNPQNNHYTQYRASNTQYNQQQPDQSYSTQTQTQSQNFTGQQQTPVSTQGTQPIQRYSSNTQQPQNYTASQPYTANHQSYSSAQQQVAPQRYQQQLNTSSPATTTYAAHQSPHFAASAGNSYSSTDGNYRSSSTNMNGSSSYGSQRSSSTTPAAASSAAYRTTGSHSLSHQQSPFGPNSGASTGTAQHRSSSAGHPTSQGMQAMASVQSFPTSTTNDWHMFDTGSMDTSGNQGALHLSSTNYGMNAASVRTPTNSGPAFNSPNMANFDTSGLGGNERYYGVGRR